MDRDKYLRLDMTDLFERGDRNAVRHFYLSGRDFDTKVLRGVHSFSFNGFFISLCISGSCSARISGRNYRISAGSLIIFYPDQLIEIQSSSPDLAWKSIIVSLDVILEFPSPVDIDIMTTALRKPVTMLDDNKMARLLEYYEFTGKQYSREAGAYREEISKTLLYALLLEICDMLRSAGDNAADIAKPRQEKLTDDFFRLMAPQDAEISFRRDQADQRAFGRRMDQFDPGQRDQDAAEGHRQDRPGNIGGAEFLQPLGDGAILPAPHWHNAIAVQKGLNGPAVLQLSITTLGGPTALRRPGTIRRSSCATRRGSIPVRPRGLRRNQRERRQARQESRS